ncbi:hypothetical protein [Hymenobacter rigui]|uniref:Outer membrane protein beta-barrel domain-containing protein n=1 Tax=Hymenobacter rigui TaxID=334424 RepID=A0A3R9V6Z7_9BACT|nr:hypothetical protein [Hymenobacter rigui]RSK48093.1 hypothetical protein EI291_13495 [Hymenobacter rigui]
MKKSIFGAIILGFSTLSVQAQIAAGTKLLSGSIGYSRQKQEQSVSLPGISTMEIKNETAYFTPSVGYFVADNLALGISAGASLNKSQGYYYVNSPYGPTYVPTENKTRSLSGGLFGRYYKFVGEKFALYGQLGGGYQNIYTSGNTANGFPRGADNRQEGFYASLLPGIVFFPTNKLGLELTLRGATYNRLTDKRDTSGSGIEVKNTTSNLDLGFGLNDLNLGISLYLGR